MAACIPETSCLHLQDVQSAKWPLIKAGKVPDSRHAPDLAAVLVQAFTQQS